MNDHESPKDKECNMKGCIINSDKVSLAEIFDCINDFEEYNCLITNIECYPLDEEISAIFSDEYCWIEGKKLLRLLEKENLQWIWKKVSRKFQELRMQV